jgi:hypothetical protein
MNADRANGDEGRNDSNCVEFAEAERDEQGHCRRRRMSMLPPFVSNAMDFMSGRRSITDPSHHGDLLWISRVKRTGTVISLLAPLLLALASLFIPAYFIPRIVTHMVPKANINLPLNLLMTFLIVLPALMFLRWCWHLMKNSFDFGGYLVKDGVEATNHKGLMRQLLPSVPMICVSLGIFFRQSRYLVEFYAEGTYSQFYMLLLDHGAAMSMFTAAVSSLDALHGAVIQYAKKVDCIASNSKQSNKWKSIMKTFRSFDDPDSDTGSAIPGGHRSPAQVLADIVGIYANLGKVASMTILILFFFDIDLYANSVAIALTVIFAGVVTALHINDALTNAISLSVSNSIHVGEIISLGRPGFNPPDNPGENVTGFLEGVTWGHVIIRDFKRKQVFIRHDEFVKLIVQNWSRRPNKDAHFIIPIVPEFSGGVDKPAKLAKYAGEWIKEHPFIDQKGYQKSVIKWSEKKGLILEAIFYPAIGGKARRIRAEFVVMILDAAKRLDICLLPAEIRTSSAWADSTESDSCLDDVDLKDLDPSPELTERAGFKPKRA